MVCLPKVKCSGNFSASVISEKERTSLTGYVGVTIVESAFQEEKFDVEGCSAKSPICRINGYFPYGVAFGLPKTYIKSVTISYQGTSYALDGTNMYNAWGNRSLEYPGTIRYFGGGCFDKKNCQFRGIFSDAAGSFVAEWLIVDGYAIRTVLTGSIDVVSLFMKNIDPPVFD
jgi:hypothetical protein